MPSRRPTPATSGHAARPHLRSLPAAVPPLWEPMRLIAFVTDSGSITHILTLPEFEFDQRVSW